MIRRHDLVKFVGPSVCKYYTSVGAETAVVEDGVFGLALSDEFEAWHGGIYRCEVLIGNEIVDADPTDLTVIQPGGKNVV